MRKRFIIGLAAAAIVLGLVAVGRHELFRFGVEEGSRLAGYTIRLGAFHIGWNAAAFDGVDVRRGADPLLNARQIVVRYSLRDLLPGSRHRFGLHDIEVDGAKLTLTRLRDGNFDFGGVGSGGAAVPAPQRVTTVPLSLRVRVRDTELELREPTAFDSSARDLRIDGVTADAIVDTAAITHYRVDGAFEARSREPFAVVGTVNALAGYAMHRARAARIPLRALANYFAQTPDVRVLRGGARNLDAVIYALGVVPNVAPSYHVSLNLEVDDGRIALVPLAMPVDQIHARLHVVDNAFFVTEARATLARIPLAISGGIYDLNSAVTGGPKLQIGVTGTGDLRDLRNAFTFTRDQPMAGHAGMGVLVEGPLSDPVIVARARAPHAFYRALPFDGVSAGVVYHANVVALAPLQANYGGVALGLRGTLHTGEHLRTQIAVHVTGSAQHLPYLDEMLGDEPMVIDAYARGDDLRFHVIGSAASARGTSRVAALVQMDGNGTARIDPFWLHTERGSLDGAYILDRPNASSAFWLASSRLTMHAPKYPAFPGLSLPQMPRIDGSMAMNLAGGGSGSRIYLGGTVSGGRTQIASVPFNSIDATFAGTMQDAAMNRLRATGPWGAFAGHGQFTSQQFVAVGNYRGTLDGLQPFLGSAITGHGPLSGPVAVAVQSHRILVQGSNLQMPGATLRGIPIDRASLTLAVEGDRLRLYSARAQAAGGAVVAAGTFGLSPRAGMATPGLSIIADRLEASQLHGIGLPLETGTLSASGDLRAGAPLPSFAGGIAIDDSRIAQFPIAGDGDINLSGNAVTLHRVIGQLGGAYAHVDGSIGDLTSGAPSYALNADVPAARIAQTLHAFKLPNYMTDGSFNARLRITGRSQTPLINGWVGVPAGEINGLPFINAGAQLSADPRGVAIGGGSVLVGTTAARFDAVSRPHVNALSLSSSRADLSDFNNFFDTGDTLDGQGSVRLSALSNDTRVSTSGNINVRGFRYRNLPIGDTRAVWSSTRNVVAGSLAIDGIHGKLDLSGQIALAPAPDFMTTFERSRFDLGTKVNALDLAFWLPALGLPNVPVTGHASGNAAIRGRYPNLGVRAAASVVGGSLGPLTLDTANVTLHAVGTRIALDRAEMATPDLRASASGSFGFGAGEPLDLRVYAATDRLAQLVYKTARYRVPVSGSFESTLTISGTYTAPKMLAGFDASDVRAYGIPISSLFGEVRLERHALVLSNAGASFAHGQATLAGSLPLGLAPLRFAAPDQPLSFDLDVVGLDPSLFDATFGSNTKLTGLIDGHIGLSGTVRDPIAIGSVSLTKGSYVSDLERTPITQIAAALAFNRTSAALTRATARAGGGTLTGSGTMQFPHGFGAGADTLTLRGKARGAVLDLPAYGSGTIDATMAVVKRPNQVALLSGDVTLRNAVLPFASFVKAATGSGTSSLPQLPLAFDVLATVGKNVRVRGNGYGAGLDIGTTGSVRLGGTLAAPTLAGTFASTGGTLTYFDRAFRVQKGDVSFNPADGVLPTLHAVASTSVVNPDPDRGRNPYGSADVSITVDGPIAGLKIGLSSTPGGYTRDQILGLIAPFGGFVNGIAFSRQAELARQQPGGITPLGSLSPIPNVALRQNSTITVGQEAFNILNAQFTAGLLAPVESSLGQGLGLSSVNLSLGYYGNVGLTATRILGKAVSAVYAVTFGLPQIQSFGLVVAPTPETTATLNFFYQSGPTKLLQLPGSPVGYNAGYLAGEPLIGNTGFSLTAAHYFW